MGGEVATSHSRGVGRRSCRLPRQPSGDDDAVNYESESSALREPVLGGDSLLVAHGHCLHKGVREVEHDLAALSTAEDPAV